MNKYETNCMTKTCKKNKNRKTWIIKENTHEPIIEKKKYDKVQEIKAGKRGKTETKYTYWLQDLLYCGNCKRKIQYKIYKSANKERFLYDSAGFNCSLYYKKRCKNKIHIREKDLNKIVKSEVIKRLSCIEIDKIADRLMDDYKKNDENRQKIEECKKEQQRLERKKNILYKKKCEFYITVEEFKKEYMKAKEEIQKYEILIKELQQRMDNVFDEKKVKEIICKLKNGTGIDNKILKEVISKIEIYSENRIEITYQF